MRECTDCIVLQRGCTYIYHLSRFGLSWSLLFHLLEYIFCTNCAPKYVEFLEVRILFSDWRFGGDCPRSLHCCADLCDSPPQKVTRTIQKAVPQQKKNAKTDK